MTFSANAIVKHIDWNFENEWRIIRINKDTNDNSDSDFYTNNIKINSIIFGMYVNEYDIQELQRLNSTAKYKNIKRTCYGLVDRDFE